MSTQTMDALEVLRILRETKAVATRIYDAGGEEVFDRLAIHIAEEEDVREGRSLIQVYLSSMCVSDDFSQLETYVYGLDQAYGQVSEEMREFADRLEASGRVSNARWAVQVRAAADRIEAID